MKRLKIVLAALVAMSVFGLTACDPNVNAVPPTVSILGVENFDTEVDPAEVSYIDVKFSESMNTNYSGFVSYYGTSYDFLETAWVNSGTYRIYADLRYGKDYKIVLNDAEYDAANPNENWKKYGFFRNKNGTYLKQFAIEFSTKPSTIEHPHDFVIDFTKENSFAAKFGDNTENGNNQQLLIFIKSWLKHELLREGDTLTVKYKINSLYDIPLIKANLVETDDYVTNYWVKLSEDEDLVAVKDYETSGDEENPVNYEGELKFTVSEDMIATAAVQLWAEYGENDKLIAFNSIGKSEN